jgi:hypothetical protein
MGDWMPQDVHYTPYLAQSFMCDGRTAEDFYYVYAPNGRKVYYSRKTGKRTALERIPKGVVNGIKEIPQNLDKAKLLKQKAAFLEQIKKLQERVTEIDTKLGTKETFDYEAVLKEEEQEKQKASRREKEERRRFFENIFKKRKVETEQNSVQRSVEFLKLHGITTKKEWKQWLLKNHPDKGGEDTELCQKIICYGREIWHLVCL